MIPKGAEGVGHLATRIAVDLIPKAADAYMGADLGMIAGLLGMVAEDYDRMADVLVSDQVDMNALFEEALGPLASAPLAPRLTEALATRPTSLRVSDLSAHADHALRLLIDLHAAVEDAEAAGAPWAEAMNRRIWTFLDAYVARRAYHSSF